jgi:hypothetical protein
MPNETQTLLTNTNVIHKCTWSSSEHAMHYRRQHCLHSVSPYIKRIKFEKLSDPDIVFPETLHEKNPTSQLPRKCSLKVKRLKSNFRPLQFQQRVVLMLLRFKQRVVSMGRAKNINIL